MASTWVALALVCVAAALIAGHFQGRWRASSVGGAITGATAITASFFIVGACIDDAVHKPEWVEPGALWTAIITAIVLFLSGALMGGPWFVTQMLADARRDEDARPDNG
jgi:uncharacterized protein YneF (UPF0154 family)